MSIENRVPHAKPARLRVLQDRAAKMWAGAFPRMLTRDQRVLGMPLQRKDETFNPPVIFDNPAVANEVWPTRSGYSISKIRSQPGPQTKEQNDQHERPLGYHTGKVLYS